MGAVDVPEFGVPPPALLVWQFMAEAALFPLAKS
jgi:hypothetical protein